MSQEPINYEAVLADLERQKGWHRDSHRCVARDEPWWW